MKITGSGRARRHEEDPPCSCLCESSCLRVFVGKKPRDEALNTLDLGDPGHQMGLRMQVESGSPFHVDVLIYPLHVFLRKAYELGHGCGRDSVVLAIEAKVHLLIRQGEIKFVLALM